MCECGIKDFAAVDRQVAVDHTTSNHSLALTALTNLSVAALATAVIALDKILWENAS